MASNDDFLRRYAKTRRFTVGVPKGFTIAPDGKQVVFLRALSGDDPTVALWAMEVATGEERLICDPRDLSVDGQDLPPEERARRERLRETGGGVVAYATDRAVTRATFTVGGALLVADLGSGEVTTLPSAGPAIDPRLDPTGRHVAYVTGGALHVRREDGRDLVLVQDDDPDVEWGVAEFVAAEEMDRHRGYWWAPDGTAVLAARVDNRPVQLWTIADPANPDAPPNRVRYPAAGTANADVSLSIVSLDGDRVEVSWDRPGFEYLTRAGWTKGRPPTIQVQSRDQRVVQVLTVDPATGTTEVIREDWDDVWIDLVDGVPAWLDDGRLVTTADDSETRRLRFADEFVTPPGLQVRAVLHVGTTAVITASQEPTEQQVLRVHADGRVEPLATDPGVHSAVASDDVAVISSVSPEHDGVRTRVVRGTDHVTSIRSVAEVPSVHVRPAIRALGSRSLRTVVLTPPDAEADATLPVLLDPYGGPHFQRVVAARTPFVMSQWFANQGFAVIVADGRGTPGRGPTWDRAIYQRVAETALDDQVDALHAAAEQDPRLDLSRVAMRGWSFGGELAAMAVLRRPDVFRAAVAGAPVTEQRLYDTHYTERYLGHPDEHPEVYRTNSLLDDAARLERPLLLIHGLADDNVVVAHTLRLSSALLAAGKPHTVLPLSGVTHMTPQEVVAENLIRLELAFLRQALGLDHEA